MPTTNHFCRHCHNNIPNGQEELVHGYYYCHTCFNDYYFRCAMCGECVCRDDDESRDSRGRFICYDCHHQHGRWSVSHFNTTGNTYTITRSARCFGIELETSECNGYLALRDRSCFGVKDDGSIDGMEFISPILSGDRGLAEVRKFCRFAHQHRFKTDRECGYHVHVDLRDTTAKQRLHIAYAYHLTIGLWVKLVHPSRLHGDWCNLPEYTSREIRQCYRGLANDDTAWSRFQDLCYSRYQFVNWQSYYNHSTVEIRGYQGTLNSPEICNWIVAHIRFVDYVKDKTFNELDALFNNERCAKRFLRRILGARIARYYAKHWRQPHQRLVY